MASGYYPSSNGPQQASKYPRVGPNYMKYGEQPGWIYDYSIDRYRRDPKVDQEIGLAKKDPTLSQSLTPMATAAGGVTLATEAAKQAIPAVKGLLASGGKEAAAEGAKAGAEQFGSEMGAEYGADMALPNPLANPMGPTPAYIPATVAIATALAGRSGVRMLQGKQKAWQKATPVDNLGRGLLAMGTFGGSEAVNYLKNRFGAKSTDQRTNDRYESLKSEDAAFQSLVDQGRQDSVEDKDTWDLGDDPNAAPTDLLARSYGVLKTFGPEWATYDSKKQEEIIKKLVAAGKINSKRGDWIIDDPEGARAIANEQGTTSGMQPVSSETALGLLGIDAGTRKRWRETNGR